MIKVIKTNKALAYSELLKFKYHKGIMDTYTFVLHPRQSISEALSLQFIICFLLLFVIIKSINCLKAN